MAKVNLINKLLKALKFNDGAIPVIQSIDTPKLKNNKKIHNLDRKKIFFSQTPQAFKYKVLMELQNKVNKETTDDSSLLITANKKIKLINIDKYALPQKVMRKITKKSFGYELIEQ